MARLDGSFSTKFSLLDGEEGSRTWDAASDDSMASALLVQWTRLKSFYTETPSPHWRLQSYACLQRKMIGGLSWSITTAAQYKLQAIMHVIWGPYYGYMKHCVVGYLV